MFDGRVDVSAFLLRIGHRRRTEDGGPMLGRDCSQAREVGRTCLGLGKDRARRPLTHLQEHAFVSHRTGSDQKEQPRLGRLEPERMGGSGRAKPKPPSTRRVSSSPRTRVTSPEAT